MPLYACPECDALLTRAAVLALHLRKLAAHWHTTQGHPGPSFTACPQEPCASTWQVLRLNHLGRESADDD